MVFSSGHVGMWELDYKESWGIDAFELWCWRRLLRVPWTARRSNQSILKEISPGCSLEGLMLKLKLHYLGYLMRRVDSFEKILMLGKIEGKAEKGMAENEMVGWHHWLNAHGFGWTPGVGDGQGGLACCRSWGRKESDTTELLNWTELNWYLSSSTLFKTTCNSSTSIYELIEYTTLVHASILWNMLLPLLIMCLCSYQWAFKI